MIEIPLPPSIKVGGFDYEVRLTSERSKELMCSSLWGLTRHSASRDISINIDVDAQRFNNTSIHEITHAVDYVYGCDLTEKQVDALANGLHQVFEQLGIRFVKG